MFVALVIDPFVIDHEYVVAPAGPLAVLPVDEAQTEEDALIVGTAGSALIVTFALFEFEHPEAFVTVRFRVVVPEAPAVYVMDWMFVALVIAPLVMDHA